MRPEHIEDAGLEREVEPAHMLEALVELRETVGSEVFVHLTLPGAPVLSETEAQSLVRSDAWIAAQGLGGTKPDAGDASASLDSFAVARFNSKSKAVLGDRIRVVVEVERLHFLIVTPGWRWRDDGGPPAAWASQAGDRRRAAGRRR